MVTIEKLLKDGMEIIKQRDYNSPRLEAELILCYLLEKDRVYIHLNRKGQVSDQVAESFYLLAEKRNQGYPCNILTIPGFMSLISSRKGPYSPRILKPWLNLSLTWLRKGTGTRRFQSLTWEQAAGP